jgi:hypothetical protein
MEADDKNIQDEKYDRCVRRIVPSTDEHQILLPPPSRDEREALLMALREDVAVRAGSCWCCYNNMHENVYNVTFCTHTWPNGN